MGSIFHKKILIIFLFVLMLGSRCVFLSADPPLNIQAHFFTDEGWKARNARNKVLFDNWMMDEHNNVLNSPLHQLVTYGIFRAFGPGLVQARSVSVLFGFLTLIVLYLYVRDNWHKKGALLSTCFSGFSFLFLTYHRVAFQESMIIFFVVLSIYLWSLGARQKGYFLLSGVAASLAYLTKASGIVALLIISTLYLAENLLRSSSQKPPGISQALVFLSGLTGSLCCYHLASSYIFGTPVTPNPLDYSGQISSGLFNLLKYFAVFPQSPVWGQMLILTLLTTIFILSKTASLARGNAIGKELSSFELETLSWFFCGCVFIGAMHFQPDRRFILLIPPMSILAAKALLDVDVVSFGGLPKIANSHRNTFKSFLYYSVLFVPIYFFLSHGLPLAMQMANRLLPGLDLSVSYKVISLISVLVPLAGIVFLFYIKNFSSSTESLGRFLLILLSIFFIVHISGAHFITKITKMLELRAGAEIGLSYSSSLFIAFILCFVTTIFIFGKVVHDNKATNIQIDRKLLTILLLVFFLVNGYCYLKYLGNLSFTIVNTSKELEAFVGQNSIIVGDVADTLALESTAYTFPVGFGCNENDPIERFKPNYALIKRFRDGKWLPIPNYLQGINIDLVKRFELCPADDGARYRFLVDLYSISSRNEPLACAGWYMQSSFLLDSETSPRFVSESDRAEHIERMVTNGISVSLRPEFAKTA